MCYMTLLVLLFMGIKISDIHICQYTNYYQKTRTFLLLCN